MTPFYFTKILCWPLEKSILIIIKIITPFVERVNKYSQCSYLNILSLISSVLYIKSLEYCNFTYLLIIQKISSKKKKVSSHWVSTNILKEMIEVNRRKSDIYLKLSELFFYNLLALLLDVPDKLRYFLHLSIFL